MLGRIQSFARSSVILLVLAGLVPAQPAAVSVAVPASLAGAERVVDAAPADLPGGEPGAFVSLDPSRVLDTRAGNGASGSVAANGTISVQITGRGGVPSAGVSAVVLNVTETGASQPGFITVYPDGTPQPTASNLNFPAGDTRANLVTVKLGSNGKVALTNSGSARVHLIADVAGYYLDGVPAAPGAFVSLAPSRVLDTRVGNGANGPVAGNGTIRVQITGRGGVPSSGVSAVVLNVTETGASQSGFITVYPDGTSQPTASNLNFPAGDTRASLVTVKLGSNGSITLTNSGAGSAHLIADLAGYYLDGVPTQPGMFVSLTPSRVLDTRVANGWNGSVAANGTIWVPVTGRGAVPTSGVSAVVLNVTETGASQPGFITVYPDGTPQPTASNVNFPAGDTRANLVTVKLGGNGKVAFANNGGGAVHLIADVAGYYLDGWSSPELLAPYFGYTQAIDCAATSFCVAGDYFGGMTTFDGARWSEPVSVDPLGHGIQAISCADASFCAAVDSGGSALTFDGSSWSEPKELLLEDGVSFSSVSCPTATFCAAVGTGRAVTFDGTSWSTPVKVDPDGFTSVSCPTATFCVALDGRADVSTFDGTRWSTQTGVIPDLGDEGLHSVSCPTTTFCASVSSQGEVITFDGARWSSRYKASASGGIPWEVDCASDVSCVGMNGSRMVVFDGVSWTPNYWPHSTAALSCPTSTFCMGAAQNGVAAVFDGTRWSEPMTANPRRGGLTSVSCPTSTFCISVEASGRTVTFDGASWSGPVKVDSRPFASRTVSCATESFCVIAGGSVGGFVSTFNGRTWSESPSISAYPLQDVSCPATTFCMAVDEIGGAYTFDGTRWSERMQISPGLFESISTVSCTSAAFCAAVSVWGSVFIFDGTSWSYVEILLGGHNQSRAFDVSCGSPTSCVAIGIDQAYVMNGTTWSAATTVAPGFSIARLSCLSASYCLAVTGEGVASTFDGASWSQPRTIAEGVWGVPGIDCTTQSFCAVVFSSGHVTTGRPPD